jgi:hypothetical protein
MNQADSATQQLTNPLVNALSATSLGHFNPKLPFKTSLFTWLMQTAFNS